MTGTTATLTEAEHALVEDELRREAEAARHASLPWVADPPSWLPSPTLTLWPLEQRETHAAREGYTFSGTRGSRPDPDGGGRVPADFSFRAGAAAAEYRVVAGSPVTVDVMGDRGVLVLMAANVNARADAGALDDRGVWPGALALLTEAIQRAGFVVKFPNALADEDRRKRLADARLHGPKALAAAEQRYPAPVYSCDATVLEFLDARAERVVEHVRRDRRRAQ